MGTNIEKIFMNEEEQLEYFNNEKIKCLICGKLRKALARHLAIHNYSIDAYRERFGITLKQGLIGTATLSKMKINTKNRMNHDGDLWQHLNSYYENFEHHELCVHGHKKTLTELGTFYCAVCSTNRYRKKFNRLPRDIAAKTLIPSFCKLCKKYLVKSKLGGHRKYCEECRKEKYNESQKKYQADREKINSNQRIAYQIRKAKTNSSEQVPEDRENSQKPIDKNVD